MPDIDDQTPIPMYVGDTAPSLSVVVRDAAGDLVDISGWTTTGASVLLQHSETEEVKTGGGTLTLTSSTSTITYAWVSADTDTAGAWDVYIRIDTSGASAFATRRLQRRIQIDPLPS